MKTKSLCLALALGLAAGLLGGAATALATDCSGGSEITSGGYKYHVFTNAGSATLTVNTAGNVEVLVVAGGGGGGGGTGGGGGAGGLIYSNALAVVNGSNYTVTVGAEGSGGSGTGVMGSNGSNSVFGTLIAYGGGGGGGGVPAGVVSIVVDMYGDVIVDPASNNMYFATDIATDGDFTNIVYSSCTTNSVTDWYYFNGDFVLAMPTNGISWPYQDISLGYVSHVWTNAARGTMYYVRYRSWNGTDWGCYRTRMKRVD